jgi:putative aminopeptidase FrvX
VIETIRTLVETYGPSGFEDRIRDVILDEIDGLADEVTVDPMGNVIAWKRSGEEGAAKVMLSAHMDEIGVMVSHVDDEGFLRFTKVGGLVINTLPGNRVVFADGTVGVIGTEDEVRTTQAPKMEQMFIDVGGDHGIEVGDAAGFMRGMEVDGDRLIAKSLDDRIGCAAQIEIMRRLESSPNDVAFVFSVQEEVGSRGARTAAYAVDPDIGIAIDVTLTGDTPKGPKMAVEMGGGPAIKIKDTGMLAAPEVVRLMVDAAERAGVPYQREVLEGGSTDAATMQLVRAGVRAGCLSIPCRFVHTTSETVDMNDVENGIKLMLELLAQPVAW